MVIVLVQSAMRETGRKNRLDRMPGIAFGLMHAVMIAKDALFPMIDRRVQGFGIRKGMTVVDYGCGPGRYTVRFSSLVGEGGRVYAIDVHEMAISAVERRKRSDGLGNVFPALAKGYDSGLPGHFADMVCAIDMFFALKDPSAFLREAHRITKPGGILLLDDGHQPRSATLRKIAASGCWKVSEETRDHITCIPVE